MNISENTIGFTICVPSNCHYNPEIVPVFHLKNKIIIEIPLSEEPLYLLYYFESILICGT